MRFNFLKQKKFLAAAVIALAIFGYYFTALGEESARLREALFYVGAPVWRAGGYLNSVWYGLTNSRTLQQRLAAQEQLLAQAESDNIKLNFLRDENRELRELLGFKALVSESVAPASVLSFSALAGRSAIIINQGSANGIKEKFAVVAPNGVLIGKVASVTPGTATVLLIVDSESSVAASLAKDSSVQAIAKGKLGLSLVLDLVPQDTALAVGDFVITSPLEEEVPPGLIIGRVAAVFYKEGELFKRANLEPIVSLANIRTVGVIIPAQ